MAMGKLFESKQKINSINSTNVDEKGNPDIVQFTSPSFEEKYRRVTTYIEKEIYQRILVLKSQGRIGKMTEFINIVINEYLHNHLQD